MRTKNPKPNMADQVTITILPFPHHQDVLKQKIHSGSQVQEEAWLVSVLAAKDTDLMTASTLQSVWYVQQKYYDWGLNYFQNICWTNHIASSFLEETAL